MVLEEIRYDLAVAKPASGGPSSKGPSKGPKLASPMDRLAAVLADLIIFLPVAAVMIAPFRKQALLAQLLGHDGDWVSAVVASSGVAAIAFLLYQTVFVSLWGATPGKRFLGLRVVSVWDDSRPRPLNAFLRSVAWCAELFVFGAPWVAVFGNERRRPFHDRLADTWVVVADGKRGVGAPTLSEMSIASGINAATLAAFGIFVSITLAKFRNDMKDGADLASEMESKGLLCRTVGEARDEWMGAKPSRVAVALSLFGAESIDESCLEMEAEYSIWRNEDQTLAYLAKSFVHSNDEELAQSYMDKVCELASKSDACTLVQLVERETGLFDEPSSAEEKADQVADEHEIEQILAKLQNPPAYLKVWVIRHLMDRGRYADALERIDEVSPHKHLGYFFARERARALWGLDRREESRLAMRSSIETFDADQRVEMARWFCSHETAEDGCSEPGRFACGMLSASVKNSTKWLANADVAAAYLRGESCQGELSAERLADLEKSMPAKEAKTYVKALTHLKKSENDKALELLKTLASDPDRQGPFFFEANARLAELASTPQDLEKIKRTWLALEPNEGWRYLGRQLAVRFNSLRAWDQTLEVGLRMVETDRFDKHLYRSLVVAAFRSGNQRMALGFLENLKTLDQGRVERSPASVDDFGQVVQELLGKGKGNP